MQKKIIAMVATLRLVLTVGVLTTRSISQYLRVVKRMIQPNVSGVRSSPTGSATSLMDCSKQRTKALWKYANIWYCIVKVWLRLSRHMQLKLYF